MTQSYGLLDILGSIPGSKHTEKFLFLFPFFFKLGDLSSMQSFLLEPRYCCDSMLTTTLSSSTSSLPITRVRLAQPTTFTVPKIKFTRLI